MKTKILVLTTLLFANIYAVSFEKLNAGCYTIGNLNISSYDDFSLRINDTTIIGIIFYFIDKDSVIKSASIVKKIIEENKIETVHEMLKFFDDNHIRYYDNFQRLEQYYINSQYFVEEYLVPKYRINSGAKIIHSDYVEEYTEWDKDTKWYNHELYTYIDHIKEYKYFNNKENIVYNDKNDPFYTVYTYKAKTEELDDYINFTADVESRNSVDVFSDTNGFVSQILVQIGQKVAKNDTIAYIDNSKEGEKYQIPIHAPISGRITSLSISCGTKVSKDTIVANISRTDELEMKVEIPEIFISQVHNGQSAIITFDALPGEKFTAKVFEISPIINKKTHTMSAKLRLLKPDDKIKIGMYARISLITQTKSNAITVPSNSVTFREDGKPYLFVIESKDSKNYAKAKLVPVLTGINLDNRTEIIKGISEGDEIVINSRTLPSVGANVKIINAY